MFDLGMIENVYAQMEEHIDNARKLLNRPLTLSEKILYSHLSNKKTEMQGLKDHKKARKHCTTKGTRLFSCN